ncbi:glycosyltransferase family 25 protein [Uliginosibacterium sp. H1]|uniref:glycosyltransferase family 25 protein n=1 Tax=Uliginosibacterium sp. H1 TaxID=3114757 RepID=UPI002E18078F|nr:glycosyltransferase family 25 protein [Uliginosibacterium sp. H1]
MPHPHDAVVPLPHGLPASMLPLQCLSLRRASVRRSAMSAEFNRLGLPFAFVDAVEPDFSEGFPESYDRDRRLALFGYDMRPGEAGCYLSHRGIWQDFLASTREYCCVLEDDVALDDRLPQVLASLLAQSQDWDLVRLYGVFERRSLRHLPLREQRWLVEYLDQPRGTQGYVLTRHAARRLLETTQQMYCAIDDAIDMEWVHGLRMFGVEPHVIRELPCTSTIGNRKRPRQSIATMLAREVRRWPQDMRRLQWMGRRMLRWTFMALRRGSPGAVSLATGKEAS